MPNWCSNSLLLSHDDKSLIDDLEKRLREHKGEQFFNLLRPRPADQEENWYEWNCENWGTKWDANLTVDVEFESMERISDNMLSFTFDTAWSPPIALYDYISDLGWNVEALYYEFGAGFLGKYSDGSDAYWEVDFGDENFEEFVNELPEDLVDYSGIQSEYESYKEWQEDGEEIDNDPNDKT